MKQGVLKYRIAVSLSTDEHETLCQLASRRGLSISQLVRAAIDQVYHLDEQDPLERWLQNSPEDDEPLTPEEEVAIEEGLAAYRRGDFVSDDELRRELGL